MAVDKETFRAAMSRFPAGVTIVTTVDGNGRPWGFTASAFSSVSLDPPLVLVCLDCGADCYPAFHTTSKFAVNILRPEHEGLALRFATKGADKFAAGQFRETEDAPVLEDALVRVHCRTEERVPAGDHTILIGEVEFADVRDGHPAVYFDRRFWLLREKD